MNRFVLSLELTRYDGSGRLSVKIFVDFTFPTDRNYLSVDVDMDTQEEEAPPIRVEQWTFFERLKGYRKGGFHPVHIDDIYHERYQVLNKLGHGSYGTVWLAEDLTLGRFVSLKILASDRISKDISEAVIPRRLTNLFMMDKSISSSSWMTFKLRVQMVLLINVLSRRCLGRHLV